MRLIVEVFLKKEQKDAKGEGILKDIKDLGIKGVNKVKTGQLYFLEGEFSPKEAHLLSQKLLTDPVVQEFKLGVPGKILAPSKFFSFGWVILVAFNPGVTDSVAESVLRGAEVMGIKGIKNVHTGQKYTLFGRLAEIEVKNIAERLLSNKVIQHHVFLTKKNYKRNLVKNFVEGQFNPIPLLDLSVKRVNLLSASDSQLMEISQKGILSLDLKEMKAIKGYFQKERRNPTDVELETLAQTWSEHCVHKTFKGIIEYEEKVDSEIRKEKVDSLLRTYLMGATYKVKKPWLISVFVDNAGIIEFDKNHEVSFKVETHNHPSAIEPFGGANTGIGGVIRDIIGVSAKPIANTNILCFGDLKQKFEDLPGNVLHPKRIYSGVIAGIGDYGNKMGIPTVNGAILFDEGYTANPLVYCGTAGIAPKGFHPRQIKKGDLVVLVGGRTGRDGIHGATFSSAELTEKTEMMTGSAVQIGNPIMEKKFLEVILKARDKKLYHAITDCGGGGLSSAVGEIAKKIGVRIELKKVPLKYQGLKPWEIWLSEAQERMILAVPEKNLKKLTELFTVEDVESTVIGKFTGDKNLTLRYQGKIVGKITMEFLHKGYPRRYLKAVWEEKKFSQPQFPDPLDLTSYLKKLLSDPNICSKEATIRRYDHEVQGGTVLKPLVGITNDGPSDAAVIKPLFNSLKGVVISCGINSQFGKIDPYWMAASVIDEAIRNNLAVGGDLNHLALLDNFCWGNPNLPDRLGDLVRATKACYRFTTAFKVPFISGKDSLNNEYLETISGKKISIPPTLLISAISVIADTRMVVSMDLKESGSLIYLLGETKDEMGGSCYYKIRGFLGHNVPKVDPSQSRKLFKKLQGAIGQGLVKACHDLSEGGLGVAAAEMAFAGGKGVGLDLKSVTNWRHLARNDTILFSESNSRFLIEVSRKKAKEFEKLMDGSCFACLGQVRQDEKFIIKGVNGRKVVFANIFELKKAWQKTLGV